MGCDEKLVECVRTGLLGVPGVSERKLFAWTVAAEAL